LIHNAPYACWPFIQSYNQACGAQMDNLLTAALATDMQILCLQPNADAGADAIRAAIDRAPRQARLRVVTHLPRVQYLAWLAHAELMLGNSSSGIIEAASFGLPVVNVGDRQRARERSGNVVDCTADTRAIGHAIRSARALRGRGFDNVYGDGRAGDRIVELLATLPLAPSLLEKCNAY
jgi:GDP/UDP-N,N'-diacetylbacillosamine 2-epimerase (hydrolysing)